MSARAPFFVYIRPVVISYNVAILSRRRLLVLLSTAILFAAAIWVLNEALPYRNVWKGFITEEDIGTYFCEKTFMDRIVRQPVNTFSNFIYWMSALAILSRGWKDQRRRKNAYNIISANPFYSITYGVILFYTFCASTFFHSSLIHVASRLDFSAVYSLALFPLMYFTHRMWLLAIGVPSNKRHRKSTITVIVVFSILYFLFTFGVPNGWDDYVVLGLIIMLIILGTIMEYVDRGKTNTRYLLVCVACILIAVVWFAFDTRKILCDPESLIQPHSLWHLFAGSATFYFYLYIRSEHLELKTSNA